MDTTSEQWHNDVLLTVFNSEFYLLESWDLFWFNK